jgi:hypothetical protein
MRIGEENCVVKNGKWKVKVEKVHHVRMMGTIASGTFGIGNARRHLFPLSALVEIPSPS